MPRRTLLSTKAQLKSIPTPNHGGRYTVISHGLIIDTINKELADKGLVISKEFYRSTSDGQVATGILHLTKGSDPDISMMFSWTNSYNKMVRFMSVAGAYVYANESNIVGNNLSNFSRKHTGTADKEAIDTIENQIGKISMYFNLIVNDKDLMKANTLSKQEQAELAGRIFIEKEIINKEQLGIVRDQIKKCDFNYNSDEDSFWAFYNHFNYALKNGHPKTWMVQQSQVHAFVLDYLYNREAEDEDLAAVEVYDPNQLSITDVLETESEVETESEKSLIDFEIETESGEEQNAQSLVEPTEEEDAKVLKEAIDNYKEAEAEESNDDDEDLDGVFDLDDLDFEDENLDLSGL